MLRHTERVASFTEARTVDTGEFLTIEVDYVTEGGVSKTLRMAHSDAAALRVFIVNEIDDMSLEVRERSWIASLRRKR